MNMYLPQRRMMKDKGSQTGWKDRHVKGSGWGDRY